MKAQGCIMLRVNLAIQHKLQLMETAEEIWDEIEKLYKKPSLTNIYVDFRHASNFKISGEKDPRTEIAKFQTYCGRLEAYSVALPIFVKSMLPINAIPQKWDKIISNIMTTISTVNELSNEGLDKICAIICAEWDRNHSNQSLSKLSTIKQKQNGPKY